MADDYYQTLQDANARLRDLVIEARAVIAEERKACADCIYLTDGGETVMDPDDAPVLQIIETMDLWLARSRIEVPK